MYTHPEVGGKDPDKEDKGDTERDLTHAQLAEQDAHS